MISLDTNVLVRYFINDDQKQQQRVKQLFAHETPLYVTKTVLLESYWVLGRFYDFSKKDIIHAFIRLYYQDNVYFEDNELIFNVFEAWKAGLDFADALHLYSSGEAKSLATFDKKFLKMANTLENTPRVYCP